MIQLYELHIDDEILIHNIYHLCNELSLARNIPVSEKFKFLEDSFPDSVIKTKQSTDTLIRIIVRVEFAEDELSKVIESFTLDVRRFVKSNSGTTRWGTSITKSPLVRLIPFETLISVDDIDQLIGSISQNSEVISEITENIERTKSEFVTTKGDGVSVQTLSTWIDLIQQATHKLESERNELKFSKENLQSELEAFENQKTELAQFESEVTSLKTTKRAIFENSRCEKSHWIIKRRQITIWSQDATFFI